MMHDRESVIHAVMRHSWGTYQTISRNDVERVMPDEMPELLTPDDMTDFTYKIFREVVAQSRAQRVAAR